MTINERIRHLRKDELDLTQSEFASKLGLKQAGVSAIERDSVAVTDRTIKAICMVFNVREEWLRTGEGEMYSSAELFSLDRFVAERGATELELAIVKALPFDRPCWSISGPALPPIPTSWKPKPSSRSICSRKKKRRPHRQLPLGPLAKSKRVDLLCPLLRPVGKTKRPHPAGCGLCY